MRKSQSAVLALALSFAGVLHGATAAAPLSLKQDVAVRVQNVAPWSVLQSMDVRTPTGASDEERMSIPGMLLAGLMVMGAIMKRRSGRRE